MPGLKSWIWLSGLVGPPRTGVVDIDSNEHKRPDAGMTVESPVNTLHEAHVVERERQHARLAVLEVPARAHAADERNAGRAREVEDSRRVIIGRCQGRPQDVKHIGEAGEDWVRAGNRYHVVDVRTGPFHALRTP